MPRRSTRLASKPRRDYAAMAGKRTRKPATKRVAKISKPLTKAIQRIVDKNIETKFAFAGVADQPLYNTIRTSLQPAQGLNFIKPCLPLLSINGTQFDELIGTRMKISSHKTIFNFNLASSNATSQDVMVKVFFLLSKNAKNNTVAAAGFTGKNLLRTGQASEEDWIPGSGLDPRIFNQLPVNRNAWILKGSRTFRLCKNGGTLNGQATGAVPVLTGVSSYQFTYDWKAGGKVCTYDESDQSSFPENYLPLVGMVAWYPDGTTVGAADQVMPVYCQFSHHLYYKDA